ncbi:MAG TPA: single-stranded DNA-binding protein [Mycobacteriales bacterium]|nr:single-stranded DNA-binding protein [Mycobacteriales bacterium]
MDTLVTVQGNLVADPNARATAAGATVVHFRVASSSRRFDRASGEFKDGDTLYISVSCWRSLGGNVLASLRKGDSVLVHGRLLHRTYDDKQGNRRSVHEIDAIAVGPDLSRCPADLRRPSRAEAGDSGRGSAPPPAATVAVQPLEQVAA